MASVTDKNLWYRVPGPSKFQNTFSQQLGVNPNEISPEFMVEDLAKSGLTPEDINAQPKFILEAFQGYILSPHYESDCYKVYAVGLEKFDLKAIKGIMKGIPGLEGIVEETPLNSKV